MDVNDRKLRFGFILQVIIPALFSGILVIVAYLTINPAVTKMLITERQQMAHEMVNSICNLMESYNERIKKGEISLYEAKGQLINTITQQRYGADHSNYFWIQDYDGNLIAHPYIGKEIKINPQITHTIFEVAHLVANEVKAHKQGVVTYTWYTPKPFLKSSLKESYAKGFPPFGWIIGTGFMLTDIESEINQLSTRVTYIISWILSGMLIILFVVLYRNYRNLLKISANERNLLSSESRFRGFAERIEYGLVIYEQNIPVFANELFHTIFGISKDELAGFDLEKYLPDYEKGRVRSILYRENKSQSHSFSTWLALNVSIEKFVSIQRINDIETQYTYLIVQDQTEQKNIHTAIDILMENLTNSPTAILITDLNGGIEYVNPGFEKVTGYSFEEVKNKNPRILNSGKMSPKIFEDLWKTIVSGEIWQGELLNMKKDGSLFWESTIIFPIKNRQNEIIKYSSIKTDITQAKRLEQELHTALDKAEENDRFKTALLNNISHEIRTPLNAIEGFSQLLKEEFSENESKYEYALIIEQNSQILLHIFEDILDVSAIESRAIRWNKEDVPLKNVLLKVISKYNTQLTIRENKPIEILVETDENFETMVLFTDRRRIIQIFDKLISNAVKFTLEGQIHIRYQIFPEYIEFFITDTGVGISEKDRDLIFTSFSHGQNLYVGLHKGLGLGLNIAKMLIELLGGELSFTSEEGKGTTFMFTFPAIDVKNYYFQGVKVDDYNHVIIGKEILIAEDNDENFNYFYCLLSYQNKILRVKTGKEAVHLLHEGVNPDFILMDILMPEMDGISATRQIRKQHPYLPIIAVTAIGTELEKHDLSLFNTVVRKPVSSQYLMEKIREVLKK